MLDAHTLAPEEDRKVETLCISSFLSLALLDYPSKLPCSGADPGFEGGGCW